MIAGTTNEDYIVKATVANLGAIAIAKKYLTDVRLAEEPDFDPSDLDSAIMKAQEGFSLFVWGIAQSEAQAQYLGANFDVLVVTLAIVGVAKQPTQVQEAIRRLASDVRRVMRQNPRRNIDGGTQTNDYCIDTKASSQPTFNYFFGNLKPSTSVGVFYTAWDATYRFPLATG